MNYVPFCRVIWKTKTIANHAHTHSHTLWCQLSHRKMHNTTRSLNMRREYADYALNIEMTIKFLHKFYFSHFVLFERDCGTIHVRFAHKHNFISSRKSVRTVFDLTASFHGDEYLVETEQKHINTYECIPLSLTQWLTKASIQWVQKSHNSFCPIVLAHNVWVFSEWAAPRCG